MFTEGNLSSGLSPDGLPPEAKWTAPKIAKPMANPNPYMAPEMQEVATQGEAPEKKDFIRAGEKELRVGDNVLVLRSNGQVEKDWQLKGFGDKFAVAEKVDAASGEILRKVMSMDDFQNWQISLEGADQPNPVARPEGFAREIKGGDMKKTAEGLGVDTSQLGWENAYTSKLRELTGV